MFHSHFNGTWLKWRLLACMIRWMEIDTWHVTNVKAYRKKSWARYVVEAEHTKAEIKSEKIKHQKRDTTSWAQRVLLNILWSHLLLETLLNFSQLNEVSGFWLEVKENMQFLSYLQHHLSMSTVLTLTQVFSLKKFPHLDLVFCVLEVKLFTPCAHQHQTAAKRDIDTNVSDYKSFWVLTIQFPVITTAISLALHSPEDIVDVSRYFYPFFLVKDFGFHLLWCSVEHKDVILNHLSRLWHLPYTLIPEKRVWFNGFSMLNK